MITASTGISSNTVNVVSFVASVAALVVSVTAIWLAIKFYAMSAAASERVRQAAREIDAGVERLEAIFEKMYADTSWHIRDAYADIRKHAWPTDRDETTGEAVEERSEAKVAELRADTARQIETLG